MCSEHQTNPKAVVSHHPVKQLAMEGDVFIHVFGVSMLLPEQKRIVLVDGRRARASEAVKGQIIPTHLPFMAVPPGSYETGIKSKMSFEYDVDGASADVDEPRFDAYPLDGDMISIENVVPPAGNNMEDDYIVGIPSMQPLAGDIQLCEAVLTGASSRVVASIDVANATMVTGGAHGQHSEHGIKFGENERKCDEKIVAAFKRNGRPRLILKRGKETEELSLTGDGPWHIMIANVPVEEIMQMSLMPEGNDVPLTHFELLYDLYHVGPGFVPKVPVCHNHHAHRAASGSHCGPPARP